MKALAAPALALGLALSLGATKADAVSSRRTPKWAACAPSRATLFLVPENLLTWSSITTKSIAGYANPITLPAADRRLESVVALVDGLRLGRRKIPSIDIRTMITVRCANGSDRLLLGTATDPDGRMYLSVDGRLGSTVTPLRTTLQSLLGED